MRVGGVRTRRGMAQAASVETMPVPTTAEPSTTGAHAVIESQVPVVLCVGQPASSGVGEQMDPSIDMAL